MINSILQTYHCYVINDINKYNKKEISWWNFKKEKKHARVRSSMARSRLCFLFNLFKIVIGNSTFSKADIVAIKLNV